MKAHNILILTLGLLCSCSLFAQSFSGASQTVASDIPHTTIPFRMEDTGTKLPDISWGLDLAWISEGNLRRGINFAGQEMIDIVRLSFQPSHSVADGALSTEQVTALKERVRIAKYARFAKINLNSDPQDGKAVASWYKTSVASTNGPRWAKLIGLTKDYVEDNGLQVVSISPFNEPDYSNWNQGTKATFRAICKAIREDNQFNGVLLCGGNVLNPDYALEWYNYSKDYLDEGNTHQLAGTFDNFANFYKQVKADGKTAVADELHNTMECMVASEYGLDKGIWWGTCDHTRSQFMKASRGTRMSYAENRSRWVAAAVYRHPETYKEGCPVQGFVGTSERQAAATTFRFAALDHDVFYNGVGPTREAIVKTPGFADTGGYDTDGIYCRNAEALVNIQGGDDIMPVMPTKTSKYRIVNAYSGMALAPQNNSAVSGTEMYQVRNTRNNLSQQWILTPDAYDVGGDFTYFTLSSVSDETLHPDVENWSLENEGRLILYQGGLGDNEKWYLEYAGNGNFYIRSKHSALCLQPAAGTAAQMKNARAIRQMEFTGATEQQWRLINIDEGDIAYNTVVPGVPTTLTATPKRASILLEWTAPTKDKDLMDYIVLRSTDQQNWHTIHNHVPATSYLDNTVEAGTTYYYQVRAVDLSLNRSKVSETVSAAATGENGCVMQIVGDSLLDGTRNGNHAALYGTLTQTEGRTGKAITLVPTENNFLQLPATIANNGEMTISTWIKWSGGNQWQRIFDFGNSTEQYMFLTPNNSYTSKMRFAIKNGGAEQTLDASVPSTNTWTHIAITISDAKVVMYVNGKLAASSTSITIRPADFRPIFNYIGRSQFSDPLFNGSINDFRIYNYALSAEEVAAIADMTDAITDPQVEASATHTGSIFDLNGRRTPPSAMKAGSVYIVKGRKVLVK